MRILWLLAGLTAMLGATGCGTTRPATFYTLTPVPDGLAPAADGPGVSVAVGPVTLPKHLDRPAIAVNEPGPEIYYADYHRWAEPLNEGMVNVLVQNLARELDSNRVAAGPWPAPLNPEVRLVASVLRFDGMPGGEAVLDVQWLLSAGGEDPPGLQRSRYRRTVDEETYSALVETMSSLLADFSIEAAEAIRGIRNRPGTE